MSDPFAPVSPQPTSYSKLGYGVMDAPDLTLRKAQIKVQQGQALNENEIHRLAQRQGLEQEALKQSFQAGANYQGVPVSVDRGLAGTSLDPVLADARVQHAQISTDPVARAKFQQQEELTSYGLVAEPGTPEAADALANAKVRQSVALHTGQPVQAVDQSLLQVSVPNFSAPAPDRSAPAGGVPGQDVQTLSPMARVAAAIPSSLNVTSKTPEQVAAEQLQKRIGGRTLSLREIRAERAKVLEEVRPTKQTRTVVDPLTRDVHEIEVEMDKFGNVYSRGEPYFKSAGPNKKVDEEFQKDFNEWTNGGAAQTKTNIQQLQESIAMLKDPNTTAASGPLASLAPDWLRSRVAPESFSIQARVEGVVQQSLRQILGGQFAQKEGEQLLKRAFDPRLPEEENARRAEVLLGTLSTMVAAKDASAEYFRQHGTIQGFKGPTSFSLGDVEAALTGSNESKGAQNPKLKAAEDAYMKSLLGQ